MILEKKNFEKQKRERIKLLSIITKWHEQTRWKKLKWDNFTCFFYLDILDQQTIIPSEYKLRKIKCFLLPNIGKYITNIC